MRTVTTNNIVLRTKDSVKERLQKWVRALRSGQYSQIVGRLRTTEGFDVLGVACDLYSRSFNVGWTINNRDLAGHFLPRNQVTHLFMNYTDQMPDVVRNYFGLSPSIASRLMSYNDSGRSFEYIADYIEQNLINTTPTYA